MTARHDVRVAEHDEVLELLPWYVNATLDPDERALVDAHLAACDECREELARCRAIAGGTRSAAQREERWEPSPRHLGQVLARIEAAEQRRIGARGRALLARLRSYAAATPRPVRWAFAAQGLAALALAAALVWRTPAPSTRYETLSRATPAAAGDRARLHLVFSADTTERELRELLQGAEALLVGGPSPRGVYTLELPVAATERERVQATAARLRADRRVRFVEVAPARSP